MFFAKYLIPTLKFLTYLNAESILLLHDGSNIEHTHSKFINNLKTKNFEVIIKPADDASLQLMEYGELKYNHLIVFAPNVDEFGGDLSASKIASFVDNGGNVLFGLDSRVTDTVRATVSEFGVETDSEETAVIDHFNFSPDFDVENDHTVLSYSAKQFYIDAKPFWPNGKAPKSSDKILFSGIGMQLSSKNSLVYPVMRGSKTAYSWVPNGVVDSMPMVLGQEMTLISAMEGRNNARVLVSGSFALFSDEFAGNNEAYALQLGLWAFQRAGVLKIEDIQHYLTNSNPRESLETYTILDQVTYSVDVFEKRDDGKGYYPAQDTDIQVEFTRMDPFVRRFLTKSTSGNMARQYMDFKLPDTYGVFKFIISYKRVGYTFIQNEITVPVRPLQHTQYERFIVTAYPYYAGAGSMLVGLFLFSFVFLYHK